MKLEVEVSDDYLANVLCSGIEGGINYWCRSIEHTGLNHPSKDCHGPMRTYFQPLIEGGFIEFTVSEEADDPRSGVEYTLDRAALMRGIQVIVEKFPRHAGAVLGDMSQQDATTGDVLIQCAIFGDIVYG